MENQSIGATFRRARIRSNMTGQQLSERSGISQSTISDIENGQRSPTINTLHKLCQTMGVSLLDVLPPEYVVRPTSFEEEDEWLKIYYSLTEKQRRSLIHTISTFLNQ